MVSRASVKPLEMFESEDYDAYSSIGHDEADAANKDYNMFFSMSLRVGVIMVVVKKVMLL